MATTSRESPTIKAATVEAKIAETLKEALGVPTTIDTKIEEMEKTLPNGGRMKTRWSPNSEKLPNVP